MTNGKHLTLEKVSHNFAEGGGVQAITLRLEPGKITALLGPSGAGKSTLLRLIAGMRKIQSGRIDLGPECLSGPKQHLPIEARRIGLIFQDFALFPHLTASENIQFGLRHLTKPQRIEIAQTWLRRLSLETRADAFPQHLSGGEQQRVAIARALAAEPDAILLDEPFSGLDPAMRETVRQQALSEIRAANIPALMVTHDPAEALAHSDVIAVLDAGQLRQMGPGDELYNKPNTLAVMRALGPVQSFQPSLLPASYKTDLPSADRLFARPEAFTMKLQAPTGFTVERIYHAGPARLAQISHEGQRLTTLVPQSLSISAGQACSVTIDRDHIFAFDAT